MAIAQWPMAIGFWLREEASCDDSLSLDSRGTMGGQKTAGLEDSAGSGEDSEGSCLVLRQNSATTEGEWCSDRRGTRYWQAGCRGKQEDVTRWTV